MSTILLYWKLLIYLGSPLLLPFIWEVVVIWETNIGLLSIVHLFGWVYHSLSEDLSHTADFQEHYCVAYAINDAMVCPYMPEKLRCISFSSRISFFVHIKLLIFFIKQ